MPRNYELLLLESIENLGLVGDVVKVRPGFARNYLLPNGMAETPTAEKIEALKEARAIAEAQVAKQRADREALIARMSGVSITLVRACNDQGILYGAVTQRDISDQLISEGYGVDMRAVRLNNPIRRVSTESVTIQFGRDLIAEITVIVKPDRIIELETPANAPSGDEPPADAEPSDAADAATSDAGKPDGKSGGKPEGKSGSKPEGKSGGKSEGKSGGKRRDKTAAAE
ncbi:MAG: 50S ribosomal protein L9 [Phycisphaerae bacterium]|nr:50S ribosomal protein L9 [Phycisphaerae bacterium]